MAVGATVQNPAGAFGETFGGEASSVVGTYQLSTAVSKGEVVALSSTTGLAIRALTNTAGALLIGVAMNDIAAGAYGLVCERGRFFGAKKDTAGALTAGNFVTASAAVTGSVAVLSAATAVTTYGDMGKAVGVVLANKTAGDTTVDLYVCKF